MSKSVVLMWWMLCFAVFMSVALRDAGRIAFLGYVPWLGVCANVLWETWEMRK